MPSAVLCADIGTSSLKAALIESDGTVVASRRVPFHLRGTEHAALEWLPAFLSAADGIRADCGTGARPLMPDGICISGNGPTLCAPDGTTLLWNAGIPHECTGKALGTKSLFIPRLAAFKSLFPQAWLSSRFILSGPEFLACSLTGKAVTFLPESRYTAAYWTHGELSRTGFCDGDEKKLAPFVAPGTSVGTTKKTDGGIISSGVPVYAGAPDFVAALAGTATLFPGALCDRAGSSEGLNLCTEVPVSAPGIRTLPSPVPGLWNASVLLPDTGMRFDAYRQLVERTEGRPVSHGEVVHALLSGESGIADAAVLRQGRELVSSIKREIAEAVETLSAAAKAAGCTAPSSLVVTGGQAANREWNVQKSRAASLPVKVPACTDAELVGDAAFALTGMGLHGSLSDAAKAVCAIRETLLPAEDKSR